MSIGLIWLILIIVVPIIALYLLSVNAAPFYLALTLGYVLYSFDSHKASSVANSLNTSHASFHLQLSTIVISLVLLLGPALITLIINIKSVHGSRKILNLLPSLFSGLFAALLIVPVLPSVTMDQITKTSYWGQLTKYQASIVAIGALIALVFFWIGSKEGKKKQAHSKSKQ